MMKASVEERMQNFHIDNQKKEIFACGRKGGVYRLNFGLDVLAVSTRLHHNQFFTCVISHEDFVFARDALGTLVKFKSDTLAPVASIFTCHFNAIDPETNEKYMEESLRSSSHGLHVFENSIFVVTGNGRVAQIDPVNFHVMRVLNINECSFSESIETSLPHQHVISDFSGWLRKGHLNSGIFEKALKIDQGPSHCVRWDKKYSRYWATADNQGGFFLVDELLQNATLQKMTCDDVEWIAADFSWSKVWIACFDHHIYEYNNKEFPELSRRIGPFKFQVKQVEFADERLFVLLESGEILRLNSKTAEIEAKMDYQGNCAWDFVIDKDNSQLIWCAMEDGSVRSVSMHEGDGSSINFSQIENFQYNFGRIRRIASLGNQRGYICISTSGYAFRINSLGEIIWKYSTGGILRDLSLSPDYDRISVVNESGDFFELNAVSGEIICHKLFDLSLWAVCYLDDGRVCIGTRRKKAFILNQSYEIDRCFETFENIKGISLDTVGNIILNGPGFVAIYDKSNFEKIQSYHDGLITTCESVALDVEDIYTCSYHVVINRFVAGNDRTVATWEDIPDFPKRIRFHTSPSSEKLLLVCGRGPFLSAYRRQEEGIFKLTDFYFAN